MENTIKIISPKICIIVSGGNIHEVLSDQEIDVEVIDFDLGPLSTNGQEKIFKEKIIEYPFCNSFDAI